MIIAIDIDSTIAELDRVWLGRYNQDYHDSLTHFQITKWAIHEFTKPECGTKIYDYLKDRTLYDDIEPYPGALEAVNYFKSHGHRVIFVTSTPPEGAGCKLFWLRKHGFLPEGNTAPDYYECHDKSLIRADLLIDDGFHNISGFPGRTILFDQPWNSDFEWRSRAVSWPEIVLGFEDGRFGIHPTELRRPVQAQAFREILDRMYRTHLDKNADYSPANILGTGWVGLVTRLWDKMARMMNLAGFRLEVINSVYECPLEPKNESVDDTLMDMAVYAIIGLLLRAGKWGR